MKARRQRELEKCNRIYTMVKKLELILCRVLGKTILHAAYLLGRFVSFSCLVWALLLCFLKNKMIGNWGCHFSFIFSLRSIPFCRSCGRSRGFPSSLERPQPAPGSCRIWTRNINRVPLPNPKGAREFLGRWKLLGRKTKVPAPQARLVYLKWLGGVPLYLLNQQFEEGVS